jgi:hypothetical protein
MTALQVKLMGWEADHRMPPILRQSDVEVVLGTSEVPPLLGPVFHQAFHLASHHGCISQSTITGGSAESGGSGEL